MKTSTINRFSKTGLAILISIGLISNASAATATENYLRAIRDNTNNILKRVNNLPTYLTALSEFMIAWMSPDDSDTTASIQANFTQLGNLLIQSATTQNTLQAQLNTDLLANTTKATLPSANDLVYSSILGSPFYTPDHRGKGVVPQYNYIKNAAGINMTHMLPAPGWHGPLDAQKRYMNYYNSVMAVQSYGGYILSSLYADGNQFNTLQSTLITQASDPQNWFAQVASENIGWVLRQILMYQSQSFVLLSQLVQTQKQMVAAEVMNNTATIASGNNEIYLIQQAKGM